MFLGVVIWMLCLMLSPSFMLNNLKCSAERPRALFESGRFTARYVRSVGRTSKTVRKA